MMKVYPSYYEWAVTNDKGKVYYTFGDVGEFLSAEPTREEIENIAEDLIECMVEEVEANDEGDYTAKEIRTLTNCREEIKESFIAALCKHYCVDD